MAARPLTVIVAPCPAEGRYLLPSFIDAHMHLESTKLLVDEFARLVLPWGRRPSPPTRTRSPTSWGQTAFIGWPDLCHDLPLDVCFMVL